MDKLHDIRSVPILIVDDEQFFRNLLNDILVSEGYMVQVAQTGQEALKMFSEGNYQVVLLDLVLPDILGTEVLVRMKEDDPDVAVIMVTAYASMESAISALRAGAYDYIKKPIIREDLVRSVDRALERQQLALRNKLLVKQLETRLKEMRALSREKEEVFRILDEGLVIIEEDGSIFDLNPKAAELLGNGTEPLTGTDISDTGLPIPEDFLASVSGAGQPVRTLLELVGGSGKSREIELVGLTMEQPTGIDRYLLGLRDLTVIRELERNREDFLAVVSHDLKAPLTSLKGFVELLLDGEYRSEETLKKYLGVLETEADRMMSLINNLLDLGRLESENINLQLAPVPVPDLLTYIVKSLEGMAGKKEVILKAAIQDDGSLVVDADRRMLIQALVNLFANAIDYSPAGGTVKGVVRNAGNSVLVEVMDEGPGIPAEERERIFDKYYQVGPTSSGRMKGSGLGLAIVKTIVELHGGKVSMNERDDAQGSRFLVSLPVSDGRVS